MREYANLGNLKRASILGALIAVMSMPRLADAGMSMSTYLPAAFLAMTLVSTAATAWGDKSGLQGIFPSKRLQLRGILIALLLGLCALPIKILLTDPILRCSLPTRMMNLAFPATTIGVIGLILWASGFENMFFNVAATSYFTRLSRNMWLAIVLSASFRTFVSSRILMAAGIQSPLILSLNAITCFIASTLFATSGLPAASIFTAIAASSVAFTVPSS